MPIVHIDILRGRPAAEKRAILDGVHAALVEAFAIPDGDRNQILAEHVAEDFERSAGRGPGFTLITMTVFPGRSLDAKRRLYAALARNLAARPGIDPADLLIVLVEPPLEDWGLRGGKAGCDVDLGFKIEV